MKHPTNKDQVVRVDGDGTTSATIREVMMYWQQSAGGGPGVSFAKALRHLAEIGAEFEKNRILNGKFPYTTEQAMKLHAHKMVGGREPTFEEGNSQ